MESRWNETDAARLGDDPLALRVYSSRLLGADPSLVLHGGGNTSVKAEFETLFGERIPTLYVKGSGWDLASIEAPGFAPCRLDALQRLAELDRLSDTEMVRQQRAALLDPFAPNPSVEAILHAILPFRYVDHSHADALVTLTNTPEGQRRIEELYGPDVLIVPYIMPGFVLAKGVYQRTRDIDWATLQGIVLMHHGLFTFDDDPRQSYQTHIRLVQMAEEYLDRQAQVAVPATLPPRQDPDLLRLAALRREVSRLRGGAVLARTDTSPAARRFCAREDAAEVGTRGLLTPDHVIRTKRIPVVVGGGALGPQLDAYAQAYAAYFQRHDDGTLTALEPSPRWAVWPGVGTVAFGRSWKETIPIRDINRHTLAAIERAEALDRWEVLAERDIFDVEYWELEQAKIRKGGAELPLLGKVALVSGGAGGIGRACVERLAASGAAVAALDIDPDVAGMFATPSILGIPCDVTDDEQLRRAVETTVARFGGLDVVVANAGTFPPSGRLESIEPATWSQSFELNVTSHQRLLAHAIPFLDRGVDPAVVVIASKNVPAPGPGAAAYSAAKAALTQLARVAALELAPKGIRVNVLHPNAVFDTAIWTPAVLEQRAASYGLSVEEYKRRNLLGVEVGSADVAEAVCALAGPAFSKTTGAQIPIDGGNERVI